MVVGLCGSLGVHAAGAQAIVALTAEEQASADTPRITVPETLKAADVASFVAPLNDSEARQLLIVELIKNAAAEPARAPMNSGFADFLGVVRATITIASDRVETLIDAWVNLPDTVDFMLLLLTGDESADGLNDGIFTLGLMIIAGAIAAALTNRICQAPRLTIANGKPRSTVGKAGFLAARLGMDVVNVAAFLLAGFALSFVLYEKVNPMRLFAVTYLSAAAIAYLAFTVARFLFAPSMADKRLVPMSTPAAKRNTIVFVALSALWAIGFLSSGFLELIGADADTLALMQLGILTVFTLILSVHLVTGHARYDDDPLIFRQWRWFAVLFIAVVTTIWAANIVLANAQAAHAAFASIFLVLSVPAIDRAMRSRLVRTRVGVGSEEPEPLGFIAVAARYGISITLLGLAAVSFVEAASGAITPWLSTPSGEQAANALWQVFLTIAVTWIIWTFVRSFIESTARREQAKAEALATEDGGEADADGGSGIVGTRTATLIPLLRGTVFVAIVAVAVMSALSALGIDIGPLLAGAGVVGIAVGFGAQALVRDVVSGIFFLIDDAFRIGEYIEMGELRGEVEKISIRSMQLRHHKGSVQTVPFGEIKSITNYNRDWVIYKQEFRVPYETDIEKVRKLIKKLGVAMLENPEYGSFFLEPLKSQGVRRIEDSALIIGTKFMCKPRKQFVLRRHVYQSIQTIFQNNGIEFARKRVIVENGNGDLLEDAAAAALEEEQPATTSPSDTR
jgi:moderate conductance mechanosensitive channel